MRLNINFLNAPRAKKNVENPPLVSIACSMYIYYYFITTVDNVTQRMIAETFRSLIMTCARNTLNKYIGDPSP